MAHQREGDKMVLHLTRHVVQAMDVAIIRSVELFLQWGDLFPVLFSTFQYRDWSNCGGHIKLSLCGFPQESCTHSSNIINQLSCILLLLLVYTIAGWSHQINVWILEYCLSGVNISTDGLFVVCVNLLNTCSIARQLKLKRPSLKWESDVRSYARGTAAVALVNLMVINVLCSATHLRRSAIVHRFQV